MNSNKKLRIAKNRKDDEFYTQYKDIEKEIIHYKEQLVGKIIYCNCDNPKNSNFYNNKLEEKKMIEISTSILNMIKGKESETIFALEKAKTDYFHIDVMDGKFVEKDTYNYMLEVSSYIKRISNLPLDVHLMVEDVKKGIDDFSSIEPNIITFLVLAAIIDLNIVVEVGLVTGVTPAIIPTGSAIST